MSVSDEEQSSLPSMLWPTTIGQDTFVDFSGSISETSPKVEEIKDKRDKEKNNKSATLNDNGEPSEKPRESTDVMKDMKERIKLKTGVFRKHLTEYLKEMGSSNATSTPCFDMEDSNKCIIWDDKGKIKHATLIKIVEKLTSDKYTGTQHIIYFIYFYFIVPT